MLYLTAALLAYLTLLIGTVVFAYRHGGADERAAAGKLSLAVIGTTVVSVFEPQTSLQVGVMLIDCALSAALFSIVLRSRRFWPVWATASQLAGTLTHLAALPGNDLPLELYATTQPMWVFPLLAAIAAGTLSSASPKAS